MLFIKAFERDADAASEQRRDACLPVPSFLFSTSKENREKIVRRSFSLK
ncbi:hypothetical protein GWI33_003860, partial [Rhynchophorus ferrugineus]